MKTYGDIFNKHNQRIYYFSKQPGNTELDKCISFLISIGCLAHRANCIIV